MLTDASVRKAVRDGIPKTLSDGTGRGTGRLLLIVRGGSTAEWYAQRYEAGKRRLSKLGNFPTVTLSEAREKFRNPPAPEKPASATVRELFEDYIAHLEASGKRSAGNIGDTLKRVSAVHGDKPANELTTADVVEVLRPIYSRGKVSMADHMRTYIRSAYSWAIRAQNDYRANVRDRFHLTVNPADHIPTEPKVPGERWLTVDELRAFWRWLGTGGIKNINRNTDPRNFTLVKLLILTGQRVEEVARIHTSMLHTPGIVDWPKTKNGRPHVLPLGVMASELLRTVKANRHGLLFPAEKLETQPVNDQQVRLVVVKYIRETKAKHFTPRDLRRTWKTLAGQAGLTKTERDLLQNHSTGDVSSVHYDRYDYLAEKKAAVAKWEAWFVQKITPP